MNKRILTRILSFVLVLCLLVPMIPYAAIMSDAASSSARFFKAGSSNYGYKSGSSWTKATTDYEAFAIDGVTYLPTALVTAAFPSNSFVSGVVETQYNNDGVLVECIEATHGKQVFSGYYINVSNMNLIAIDTSTTAFDGMSNDDQVTLMKSFLFDQLTSYKADDSFSLTNALTTSSVPSLDHPYLLADQSEFDYLSRQYKGNLNDGESEDPVLKEYLDALVAEADSIFTEYTWSDGSFKSTAGLSAGQSKLSDMPNASNNGYDAGGRQPASGQHTLRISKLAYAYQVTKDEKYATLALDYAEAISQWGHWGVGHFLNTADAAFSMALAYDWCYNVWGDIDSAKRNTVRNALFTKGVVSGIISSAGQSTLVDYDVTCPWYNPASGLTDGSGMYYQHRENNWNAVCASGMILASLALLGDTSTFGSINMSNQKSGVGSGTNTALSSYVLYTTTTSNDCGQTSTSNHYLNDLVGTTIQSACVWLINNNMAHLEAIGLDEYMPDGSYIESATYWAYGTGSLMRLIAALDSTLGTDYGLSSAWGLDNTAYFSYYVQSSDGDVWRYHDDGATDGKLDISVNGLYGAVIGDSRITAYRKYLIEKGETLVSFYDTFSYDATVGAGSVSSIPLDRYMEGMQGYTVRDSWESGGIYAAFMGGEYILGHGQLDSGAFVYYNNGVKWLQDVGCDNYNAYGYGYGQKMTSLKYYPTSAEGNNTLVTNALQYGQYAKNNSGSITEYGEATVTAHGEYGSAGAYAVIDQTAAYTGAASSAKRGMLFTNDRTTVVIQDEVSFNSNLKEYGTSNAHTAYWFAHVLDSIEITISKDGQTAYLTDGNTIIRCSIVTGNDDTATRAKFTVTDCSYTEENMVLSGTDQTGNYSVNNGGDAQYTFDQWQRLTVACTGITTMKLAIVIEEVAPGDNYGVGYEWHDMSTWGVSFTPSSGSNGYDGKVLLDKNFDDRGIGTFESNVGNFRYTNTLADGDNAMGMYSTSSSTSSGITLTAAEGKTAYASIGDGLLVVELDARQLEAFATSDGSVLLELWGTDIYPNASIDLLSLGLGDSWNRVTLVIDEATDNLYVFVNDNLVSVDTEYRSRSYQNLKLLVKADGAFTAGKLLIDNVVIRTYTEGYTALDGYLKDSAQSSVGISSWTDRSCELVYTGNVAKLYTEAPGSADDDEDTPIIDFWTTDTAANEIEAQASLISNAVYATSADDLATKLNSGTYKYAELLIPVTTRISIEKPVTVNTNGHAFYAVSESLICRVSGNERTYEKGTIRVTYVVDDIVYTTDLTSSMPFSMSAAAGGVIQERRNSDGSYSYISTKQGCWSDRFAGEQLSEYELIVTSANSKFYSTGDLYTGAFVVVGTDGKITGYTESDAIYFLTAMKQAHKRISLTANLYIDASNDGVTANGINANTNIYLNGYTLTYYTAVQSDHLFGVSGANLNVYGPGTINITAPDSNLIMQSGYGISNFNGITVRGVYNLTDIRMGTCNFNNCTIYSDARSHAFTVTNRESGQDNYTSDVSKMGILRFNGGMVEHSGREYAILVKDNSRLVLDGGVSISATNAKCAVMLQQSANNCLKGDDLNGNYVEHIRLYLGEAYFTAAKAIDYENQIGANLGIFDNTVFYIEGISFATDSLDHSYASSSFDSDVGYTVGEHVLARTGSAAHAWVVVKRENAATVTWVGDSGTHTEYWAEGSIPYAIGTAKSLLSASSAYNMYSLHGGYVEGGESYEFSSVAKASLDIRMNVALNSDFTINFFVEKKDGINYIMANGERVNIEELRVVELNGKDYYEIVIKNIAPARAAELFSVVVNVGDNVHVTAVSSILNYAEKVLSSAIGGSITAKLQELMSAIVEYIGAAAAYSGDRMTERACRDMVNSYASAKNDIEIYATEPGTSEVSGAVKSAYLSLGAKPAFVFRFRSDFTGKLKISYTTYTGSVATVTVEVEEGTVKGSGDDIYVLTMKAYDMGADLTLTVYDSAGASIGSCGYGLSEYYSMAVERNDELYRLLSALEAYTYTAREYTKERNGVA